MEKIAYRVAWQEFGKKYAVVKEVVKEEDEKGTQATSPLDIGVS